MRVISGKYKGRKILGYDISGTRPTMDRVKESLFAMINSEVVDAIVLDLFSGSGNLGIEAISMGAEYTYLVDKNKKAYNTILQNMKNIGIDNCKVMCLDYTSALKYFYDEEIFFDIILLDPPYDTSYVKKSISLISKYNLLKKGGLCVVESDSLDKIHNDGEYTLVKSKKYGDKYIVILRKV